MPAFAAPHGYELMRNLRWKAQESLRDEIKSSACLGTRDDNCCCWITLLLTGFPWVLLPIGYLVEAAQHGQPLKFAATLAGIVLVGVILWGIHRAEIQATRNRLRRELKYHMPYLRRVLFDEGLLALLLSEDPYDAVPGLGRVARIPGSQVLTRHGKAGAGALADRIQVLALNFRRICEHYRIGTMAVQSSRLTGPVHPERLKGTAYNAYLLVLAEGILGEETDIDAVLGG